MKALVGLTDAQWQLVLECVDTEIEAAADQARDGDEDAKASLEEADTLYCAIVEELGPEWAAKNLK